MRQMFPRRAPIAAIAAIAGLAGVLACARDGAGGAAPEPIRFVIGPAAAADREAEARALQPCPPHHSDPSGWSEWELPGTGIRLRLPPEYRLVEDSSADVALWEGPGHSLVVVGTHEGDGLTTTLARPVGDAEAAGTGSCRIEVAGRAATVVHSWSRIGGTTYYHARVDLGIRDGLGVGAAVLASSAGQREEFLAALSTLRVGRR